MQEELSAAKQKLWTTVMGQRAPPAHRHHQRTRGVSSGDRPVSKPADVVRFHAPLPLADWGVHATDPISARHFLSAQRGQDLPDGRSPCRRAALH